MKTELLELLAAWDAAVVELEQDADFVWGTPDAAMPRLNALFESIRQKLEANESAERSG